MENPVWRSELYFNNVSHLSVEQAEKLIRQLNIAVMNVCLDYGVE